MRAWPVLLSLPLAGCFGEEPAQECATSTSIVIETSLGDITVGLEGASDAFASAVDEGIYGATIFDRILPGAYIEGGRLYPNGVAKPAQDAPAASGDAPAGAVRMTGDGAGFRILTDGAGPCDGPGTVGHVTDGSDVVRAIGQSTPGTSHEDGSYTPVRPVFIHRAYELPAGPARFEAGAVTPNVTVRDNASVVLWAHNAGGRADTALWTATLPRGWTVTYSDDVSLLPDGFRDWVQNAAGNLDIAYPDWTYTVATVTPPANADTATLRFTLDSAQVAVSAVIGADADQATTGDTVSMTYVGSLDDGSRFGDGRFEVTLGDGRLFPAFEAALVGVAEGDTLTVDLPAALAHGFDVTAPDLEPLRGRRLIYDVAVEGVSGP